MGEEQGVMTQTVEPAILAMYRFGPPEIEFCGRCWIRGETIPVTAAELKQMRARTDEWTLFGFEEV